MATSTPAHGAPFGVIFGCNRQTQDACLKKEIFGMSSAYLGLVSAIVPGTTLFLFNFTTKELHGVFEAVSHGGTGAEVDFMADFPAQVRIRRRYAAVSIQERAFPRDLRPDGGQFSMRRSSLNAHQVQALLRAFNAQESFSQYLTARSKAILKWQPQDEAQGEGGRKEVVEEEEEEDSGRKSRKETSPAPVKEEAHMEQDLAQQAFEMFSVVMGWKQAIPQDQQLEKVGDEMKGVEVDKVTVDNGTAAICLANEGAGANQHLDKDAGAIQNADESARLRCYTNDFFAGLESEHALLEYAPAQSVTRVDQEDNPVVDLEDISRVEPEDKPLMEPEDIPRMDPVEPPPVDPKDLSELEEGEIESGESLSPELRRRSASHARRNRKASKKEKTSKKEEKGKKKGEKKEEKGKKKKKGEKKEEKGRKKEPGQERVLGTERYVMSSEDEPVLGTERYVMSSEDEPDFEPGQTLLQPTARPPSLPLHPAPAPASLLPPPPLPLPMDTTDSILRLTSEESDACRAALEEAVQHKLLGTSSMPEPPPGSDFATKELLGSSALAAEVKKAILQEHGKALPMESLRAIGQVALCPEALSTLYEQIGVCTVLEEKEEFTPSKRADVLEAIFADLAANRAAAPDAADRVAECIANVSVRLGHAMWLVGRGRPDGPGGPRPPMSTTDAHRSFLRKFEYSGTGRMYTHSSLRGGRDYCTSTGKLLVPDEPGAQRQLARAIAACYAAHAPLTLVEMSTIHHPYVEDLDIDAKALGVHAQPPDSLLHHTHFWEFRAHLLWKLFPKRADEMLHVLVSTSLPPKALIWLEDATGDRAMESCKLLGYPQRLCSIQLGSVEEPILELVLFSASGPNHEKGCPKTSYHCVWPDLVVDRERAHAIRLHSIDGFKKGAVEHSWLGNLERELTRLTTSPPPSATQTVWRNDLDRAPAKPVAHPEPDADESAFDTLIDITGVRAGSLRMVHPSTPCLMLDLSSPELLAVYNDKVIKPTQAYARRPLLPVGVLRFHKSSDALYGVKLSWIHKDEKSLSGEEWVLHGSVRLPDGIPLTPWRSPLPAKSWKRRKAKVGASGSGRRMPETRQQFVARVQAEMLADAKRIRRRFTGSGRSLQTLVDEAMGEEEEGGGGSLQQIPARGAKFGNKSYLYRNPRVKGCIHLQLPSGELRIQGNAEQQAYLLDIVKEFTEPWDGEVQISKKNLQLLNDSDLMKNRIRGMGSKGKGSKGKLSKGKAKMRSDDMRSDDRIGRFLDRYQSDYGNPWGRYDLLRYDPGRSRSRSRSR
eukprot:gene4597-5630_t